MAPQQYPVTSNARQNVKLPDRLKCKICQKFKPVEGNYSANELKNLKYRAETGQKIDPDDTGVRCRLCTGSHPGEMKCSGPCGNVLPLNDFSKASRKAGGNQTCKSCTAWKEQQEVGVETEAPPSAYGPSQAYVYDASAAQDTDNNSDPEGGYWSDDDYAASSVTPSYLTAPTAPPAPQAGSSRGFNASSVLQPTSIQTASNGPSMVTGNAASSIVTSSTAPIAPRLRGSLTSAASTASLPPHLRGTTTAAVAPHLRGVPSSIASGPPQLRGLNNIASAAANLSLSGGASSDISSVSNPYESISTSGTLVAAPAGRGPPQTFNAYDNHGQLHVQQRAPSGTTTTRTPSGSAAAGTLPAWGPVSTNESSKTGWAKPTKVSNAPSARRDLPVTHSRPARQGENRFDDDDDESDLM